MLFGMLSQLDPRNNMLDGIEIPPWEGAILRTPNGSCAKMAEPINILFGLWTRVGPRKHVLDEVQILA